MSDKDVMVEMWRVFASGLGGQYGHMGPLNLDWLSIGRIQGMRDANGWQKEVRELSYWMFEFSWGKVSFAE